MCLDQCRSKIPTYVLLAIFNIFIAKWEGESTFLFWGGYMILMLICIINIKIIVIVHYYSVTRFIIQVHHMD